MLWSAMAGGIHQFRYAERMRLPETNEEAVGFARNAGRTGAEAWLALGRRDETRDTRELAAYFTAIASASKLPLIIPVSNQALTADFRIGLAKNLPSVRYVKEVKGLLTVMTGGAARIRRSHAPRRRGVFDTTVMRATRQMGMDEWDQRELDANFEVLRPCFRVK